MNYFDVYLHRMNRDGTNVQERIKSRKEREFDKIFLPRSKYKGTIYSINDETKNISCAIEPNKWNQDKILSNLLVSAKESKLKCGDILKTYQKVKQVEYDKIWLVVMVNEDISHGYQSYQIIELIDYINYTDEYGTTLEAFPVKFVSETSVFVQDKFMSYGAVSYREPLAHRKFITRDYNFLKKELYFEHKGRGWEIVGIDNISIPGVAYVSIDEHLIREPEPNTSKDILVGDDDNFFLNCQRGER